MVGPYVIRGVRFFFNEGTDFAIFALWCNLAHCRARVPPNDRYAVSKKPFGSFAPKDQYGLIFGPFRPFRKTTVSLLSLCLPFARELCFGPKSKAANRKNRPPFFCGNFCRYLLFGKRGVCRTLPRINAPDQRRFHAHDARIQSGTAMPKRILPRKKNYDKRFNNLL